MSVRPGAPVADADALAAVHAAQRRAVAASVKGACTAGCGVPLDPAATVGGFTVHPGCEPEFVPLTAADLTARIRHLGSIARARKAARGRRR